ncbi:hypothetical protein [Ramlibacter alkalitolerans]|uniref:Secreted protein n=1 Tax=Ramlibacter alkalitolerans TaxID=2039631 RepID=A0ABS1JNN1_9BURK|nr:hypothetical protein [Ramlibacter alkalitolerans]MBL0425130.1 hypothetical protein [Ramlibacter alkalitolerans]
MQQVVAVIALQGVVAGAAIDRVAAGAALQRVAAATPGDRFVEHRPDDVVCGVGGRHHGSAHLLAQVVPSPTTMLSTAGSKDGSPTPSK